MKLIILGASGLIGNALFREAKNAGHTLIGTYNDYPVDNLYKLDYGDKYQLIKLLDQFPPDIILCPAGKTNVDWIEEYPRIAWQTNVEKLNILFNIASERNIPIAFFSSDYIFDGKEGPYSEDSIPNPLNVYGKQKLASEIMLNSFLPQRSFVFRTTWVFGQEKQGKNFVYSIVKNLSSNNEMEISEDMISTPSYARDIAKFSLQIIKSNKNGIFNLVNDERLTRVEFAKKIVCAFGLNESLIVPVKSSALKFIAKRPLNAGLLNHKSAQATNLSWTPLDMALKETRKEMENEKQFPFDSKEIISQTVSKNGIEDKKTSSRICIFIPCYNATVTLPRVFERIPKEVKEKVEEIFVVDNDSNDYTYLMAIGYREKKSDIKNLKILKNVKNFGYGGSQKLAYAYAIKNQYDMVIMLHGDAQYAPEKLPVMIEEMEKNKSVDLLFGSRMSGDPIKGGMPIHRFLGNKILTFIQNMLLGTNISEFHSGYRIFRTSALDKVPFHLCSNDYHFDTEIIILFIKNKFKIAEIPIDTSYGQEKNYVKIWEYGMNVLITTFCYFLHTKGIRKYKLYESGLKVDTDKIFNELKTEVY